jgi:hypothetical protein
VVRQSQKTRKMRCPKRACQAYFRTIRREYYGVIPQPSFLLDLAELAGHQGRVSGEMELRLITATTSTFQFNQILGKSKTVSPKYCDSDVSPAKSRALFLTSESQPQIYGL